MTWKRSTLLLVFADPEFEGLEVRTKRFAIGDLLLLDALAIERTNERLEQVADMLADRILSWNYVDENDMPVEISPKGIKSEVDGPFFQELIGAIRRASAGVAAPLETPSADTSLEMSLPMESL